jgi:DNA-directed RNA polymerase specialized sigma24 family protein
MGATPTPEFIFTEYAKTLIRIKARQLCRRPEFEESEQDDVRQDLWLQLAAKARQFDPRRASLTTFTDRVICSRVSILLRSRRRQCRAPWSRTLSLERTLLEVDGTATPISQTVSNDALYHRAGRPFVGSTARQEDAEAFAVAFSKMPAGLRRVCRSLLHGTVSSTARDLATSRRQVRKAVDRIRSYFEQVGFVTEDLSGQMALERHK